MNFDLLSQAAETQRLFYRLSVIFHKIVKTTYRPKG